MTSLNAFVLAVALLSMFVALAMAGRPGSIHRPLQQRKGAVVKPEVEEMKRLRATVAEQQTTIQQLTDRLDSVSHRVDTCQKDIRRTSSYVDRAVMGKHVGKESVMSDMPNAYDTTLYTCVYGVIDMACPDGLVFIATASFGQYASACADECCAPDPANDCTEVMQDYNDEEWNNVKLACNYETDCEFQHRPHIMTTCPTTSTADYMTVTYICSNEEPPQAAVPQVAFTAYADSSIDYSNTDVITFDNIVTNIGNHYNGTTFVCPLDGLYQFHFSIMSEVSEEVRANLMLDDDVIVSGWADYSSGFSPHTSNVALVECSAGQEVYMRCSFAGPVYSSTDRYSTFSGFLISQNA